MSVRKTEKEIFFLLLGTANSKRPSRFEGRSRGGAEFMADRNTQETSLVSLSSSSSQIPISNLD